MVSLSKKCLKRFLKAQRPAKIYASSGTEGWNEAWVHCAERSGGHRGRLPLCRRAWLQRVRVQLLGRFQGSDGRDRGSNASDPGSLWARVLDVRPVGLEPYCERPGRAHRKPQTTYASDRFCPNHAGADFDYWWRSP